MAEVALDRLAKHFGDVAAVRDVTLDIAHNEFVVLVGPSGCGKSTTLRMIAGLEEISAGTVRIGDRVVNDLPPRKRNVAMVFQNYALYPHMSVRGNLGFGLKLAGQPAAEIERRVEEAAETLGLEHLLDRQPAQLSGGERQRVAMGRAIVRDPDVFLFDEPLSNLDAQLRLQMRTEIKRLHQKVRTTVIYVTHDQVEAMTLADRIVIMRDGVVEQEGPPEEIFLHPANVFVARFIGSPPMNLLAATVVADGNGPGLSLGEGWRLPLLAGLKDRVSAGDSVVLGVRPDDLVPHGHGQPPQRKETFESTVAIVEPLGNETLLFLEIGAAEAVARMLAPRPVKAGERVRFDVNLDRLHLFERESGRAIRLPAGGRA